MSNSIFSHFMEAVVDVLIKGEKKKQVNYYYSWENQKNLSNMVSPQVQPLAKLSVTPIHDLVTSLLLLCVTHCTDVSLSKLPVIHLNLDVTKSNSYCAQDPQSTN